ncbi:SH3 domain-containing protein [Streptomyces sp. NPDC048362]|uniref:SH3 domain-containing protein n=1 Tax=Streptomyces sp. NPDC048362 TaxID=3365539 RepID=UPI00371E2F7C
MIRRTLKSGLLATVAVLAFLPTAAGAASASAAPVRTAPAAAVRHDHTRHAGDRSRHIGLRVRHHRGHLTHRAQHRIHHLEYRVGRTGRFPLPAAVHRLTARTTGTTSAAYRFAVLGTARRVAAPASGRVATRHTRLNVRSGPGTGYRVTGHLRAHRVVRLTCRTHGSGVFGNHTWYRLPHHEGYVSAHYVRVNRALPWC